MAVSNLPVRMLDCPRNDYIHQ